MLLLGQRLIFIKPGFSVVVPCKAYDNNHITWCWLRYEVQTNYTKKQKIFIFYLQYNWTTFLKVTNLHYFTSRKFEENLINCQSFNLRHSFELKTVTENVAKAARLVHTSPLLLQFSPTPSKHP